MERMPIGFELPPKDGEDKKSPEAALESAAEKTNVSTEESSRAKENPGHDVAHEESDQRIEGEQQKDAVREVGDSGTEKPVRTLEEVTGLFREAEDIKAREPDGELGGAGREAKLRWEDAFDEFARHPDFSSLESEPDVKKKLADTLGKYSKYQEIEDRSKSDTGHVYTESDIRTINEARKAVRGFFDEMVRRSESGAQEASGLHRKEEHAAPEPPADLPVMEGDGTHKERRQPDEAVIDATIAKVKKLVTEKMEKVSREKGKVVDLDAERERRGKGKKKEPEEASMRTMSARPEKIMRDAPEESGTSEAGTRREEWPSEEDWRAFQPNVGDTIQIPSDMPDTPFEDGWRVESVKRNSKDSRVIEGIVVLKDMKGKKFRRTISGPDALRVNRQLTGGGLEDAKTEASPQRKERPKRVFNIGEKVRIQRSDSTMEGNWVVGTTDGKTGKIAVYRQEGELVKHVAPEELVKWNRDEEGRNAEGADGAGGDGPRENRSERTSEKEGKSSRGRTEGGGGSEKPPESPNSKLRKIVERLDSTTGGKLGELFEQLKMNTIDRARFFYESKVYAYHNRRALEYQREKAQYERDIDRIRWAQAKYHESVPGRKFEISKYQRHEGKKAVEKGAEKIRKLEHDKRAVEMKLERRSQKREKFEKSRDDLLKQAQEQIGERLQPYGERMRRLNSHVEKLRRFIDSHAREEKLIAERKKTLESRLAATSRAEKNILKAILGGINEKQTMLAKHIREGREQVARLTKQVAGIDARARVWRATRSRLERLAV